MKLKKKRNTTKDSMNRTRNICSNDPCGAGVACHPTENSFLCLCDDGSQIPQGQTCTNIKAANLTPPAKAVAQSNYDTIESSQDAVLGLAAILIFCVLIVTVIFHCKRKRIWMLLKYRNQFKITQSTNENITSICSLETFNMASNPNYYTSAPEQSICHPFQSMSVQIIDKDQIKSLSDLGEGGFGKVYKGEYFEINNTNCNKSQNFIANQTKQESEEVLSAPTKTKTASCAYETTSKKTVAVKVLKEAVTAETESDFMREVEIMSTFNHNNILPLIGVVLPEQGSHPWMVFEYMPYGDLARLLRMSDKFYVNTYTEAKTFSHDDLMSISKQIAAGMEYLSEQHFVHRDLACRNCLVGENLTVKISDFGLSRDVYTCDYYKMEGRSTKLPIRWMAPESIIYSKFTLESDVWSYGVVLWEIFTLGKLPYYGKSIEEVMEQIQEGIPLTPPDNCPNLIKTIMTGCWSIEPHNRLTFQQIYQSLNNDREIKVSNNWESLQLLSASTYEYLCLQDSQESELNEIPQNKTSNKENFAVNTKSFIPPERHLNLDIKFSSIKDQYNPKTKEIDTTLNPIPQVNKIFLPTQEIVSLQKTNHSYQNFNKNSHIKNVATLLDSDDYLLPKTRNPTNNTYLKMV